MNLEPPKKPRTGRWIAAGLVLVAMGAAIVTAWYTFPATRLAARPEVPPVVSVQRADLDVILRAGGVVESAKRTMIQCELETLQYSNEGRTQGAGGRSTILEIIPDGTEVKRNDVLCRLDSSDYEELVRQQEIKVDQSRNDHLKAELDVKAAEVSLIQYRDGLLPSQLQGLDGQIMLAKSDLRRQQDRLEWAEKMLRNGYFSPGQMTTENQRLLAAQVGLDRLVGQRKLLSTYQSAAQLRVLENALASARSVLSSQEVRLRRTEAQLARFRRQVERCTVRAPHDGFVIYANSKSSSNRVEVGSQVFQKMNLFYLPDLSQMEVQAVLNESIIDRIREKQSVRVRIDALPNYELEGDVVSIDRMPIVGRGLASFSDVKNYLGRIRLRSSPRGLLPGMTAEVEIQTAHASRALVIPTESLVSESGTDYCYVSRPDGLERRVVQVGQGTRDLLEIRSGLAEGEEIVRDPSQLDESAIELAASPTPPPAESVPHEAEPAAPTAH